MVDQNALGAGIDDNGNFYNRFDMYMDKMEDWMKENSNATPEEFRDELAGIIATEMAKEYGDDDNG